MKFAQQIRIDIVAQFGPDMCKYAKRVEGLLRDKGFARHKREVNVFIVALKENGVLNLLVGTEDGSFEQCDRSRFFKLRSIQKLVCVHARVMWISP